MNFLQGVQRLARECDIASAPTTVVSQTGQAQKLVDWYNTAWMDIQRAHQDWNWMRTSLAGFSTVAGQAIYTPTECGATNFGMWDKESFRGYLTSAGTAGEYFMYHMEYDDWRDVYQYGSARTNQSQPILFTVTPNKSIGLGPVPLVGYTITGDYYTLPTEMSADADTPALPSHFHMAIVYRAMMSYGAFMGAADVYQRGEIEFKRLMRRIEKDRLPTVGYGNPLA